jgi:hypothetical protein
VADSTIDSELFILYDRLPGAPDPNLGVPYGGFTGATHHNTATAMYPVGTKIEVYNTTGVTGWTRFVYGKLEEVDASNALKVKMFCAIEGTAKAPYAFTNEVATQIGESVSPIVAAIGEMTENYYGWFWCGGVCPEEYVATMADNFYTTGDVAIGPITSGNLATPGTTAGEIGLELPNADTDLIIGWSFSLDAA